MRDLDDTNEEPEIVGRLLRLAGARPDAPAEVKERVHAAVRARWLASRAARRRPSWLVWLAGSAAAVTAAAILIVVLEDRAGSVAPPAPRGQAATLVFAFGPVRGAGGAVINTGSEIPSGTVLQTDRDARAALRLATGVSIRMDVRTRVTFVSGSKLDLAEGTIYVDSGMATDPLRRLEIRTGFGVLRDVGTRFEASLQDTGLRVRVRQGVVQIEREGQSHEARSGAQMNINREGIVTWKEVLPFGEEWNWVLEAAPEFELEGRTLAEFLGWVSSETGFTVRFEDDSIEQSAKGIVLHGSVAGIRPDKAPDVVLPTCGLSHRVVRNTLIVGPAKGGGGNE